MTSQAAIYISPNGYTDSFGPNVAQILTQGTRVVRGRIPAQVRAQLSAAVKAGALGRLPKDGLRPEIFFHPDHKNSAKDRQDREARYSIDCISTVMGGPTAEERVDAAVASLAGL